MRMITICFHQMLKKALASGRVKIKNGFDTTVDDGQEDLKSLSLADGGNTVKEGGSGGGADHGAEGGDESRQEDTKGNVENGFKPHVKGGGDSQPYNGHRWGLGCCHFVRQVPEEETFRLKYSQKRQNSIHATSKVSK